MYMTVVHCRSVAMMECRVVVRVREGDGRSWRDMAEIRKGAWLDKRSKARPSVWGVVFVEGE